jgi:lipoprotein-anchoring transpeptidase ErfK/SrfK
LALLLGAATAFAQHLSRDEIVSLQAALDDAGFSPGLIDGSFGGLSRQALAAWQSAHDLKPTGEFDQPTAAAFPASGPVFTNIALPEIELAPIPEDWLARSKLKTMGFSTLTEMLAEQSHCTENLIRVTNASARVLNHLPAKLPKATRLRVNLSGKTITAYDEAGKLIALFPCSIAADQEKRPVGELTVTTVALNPDYTFDPANFPELEDQQKGYGKLMIPPGPNNPVGAAWIGLSRPGYGIHGTPHPEQIGRTFSHGCFRLANWNATRLAQMVNIGTPVEVVE